MLRYTTRISLLVCAALAGCSVSFRSTKGGSLAPGRAANGTSNSLVFSDEGGILSRLGLLGLSVGAAAGSVENVQSTSSSTRVGDTIVTTTTTTGEINQQTAAAAANIANTATDTNVALRSNNDGLASTLEIYSTKLGGDTWGWRYDLGWAFRRLSGNQHRSSGLRGFIGMGVGSLKMQREWNYAPGAGTTEWHNYFWHFPVRLGYLWGNRLHARDGKPTSYAEAFAAADLNFLALLDTDTSPFHFGVRGHYRILLTEAGISASIGKPSSWFFLIGLGR